LVRFYAVEKRMAEEREEARRNATPTAPPMTDTDDDE
jgi:hypothetical protein